MLVKLLVVLLILTLTSSQVFTLLTPLDLNKLRAAQLKAHNALRAKHQSPPLVLNNKLNQVAQAYAQKIANQHNLVHSNGNYGENLYWRWGRPTVNYPTAGASYSWYDEIKYYNFITFQSNTPGKMIGHFTALVWKESSQVGFGYKIVPQKGGYALYVVANYDPPGNYIGQQEENVLRPK